MHDGQKTDLGACPICAAPIDDDRTLVEYESDGCDHVFAECPDCLNIVHPE